MKRRIRYPSEFLPDDIGGDTRCYYCDVKLPDIDSDATNEGYCCETCRSLDLGKGLPPAIKVRVERLRKALDNRPHIPSGSIESLFEFAPEGDFEWDAPEAGDWQVYKCHDKDCQEPWHRIAYALILKRVKGRRRVEYVACDEDGNWDLIESWEDGWGEYGPNATSLLRHLATEFDDFFVGWARYYLEVFETGNDVLNAATRPCIKEGWLLAAETILEIGSNEDNNEIID